MKKQPRARTNVEDMKLDLLANLAILRGKLLDSDKDPDIETVHAFAHVESFCAVAIRVMAETNPSKIKSAAMTVEIQARMSGVECLD